MYRAALEPAFQHALGYLDGIDDRKVAQPGSHDQLQQLLGGPLPDLGQEPAEIVATLARAVDPALVATGGPRYFGFVAGGTLPAAMAADWLTSAWDQNAGLHAMSPAAAQVEGIVAGWIKQLLGLPETASVGLVTGCQMANFTGLAAARGEVLRQKGWDLEAQGLSGAPPIHVLVGAEAHATIFTALRLLGIGRQQITAVPADDQGRMRAEALAERLAASVGRPTIVCAQAGNVNSGAFDPMAEIAAAAHAHGAWLHIDGAFGLWAACHPDRRRLLEGHHLADSWATDGHKWLNVPYDSGIAIVRDPGAHRRAVANTPAAYLMAAAPGQRDGQDWVPESSRRARGFALYAGLRSLGRQGVVELIDRTCGLAVQMAERLGQLPGVTVLNQVVLNQVLLAVRPSAAQDSPQALIARLVEGIARDGTCWAGSTLWQGHHALRLSLSGWRMTAPQIDRATAAIAAAIASARLAGGAERDRG